MSIARFLRPLAAGLFGLSLLSACQKVTEENAVVTGGETDVCEKNRNASTGVPGLFTTAEMSMLRFNSCQTVDPVEDYYALPPDEAADRASGAKNKFWEPGSTLRVRFLDGSAALQNKVLAYARQWEGSAGVHFVQVTSGAAEVRVQFEEDGHWSYIGTDNLTIDACEKTMNLELKDNTPDYIVKAVTLHEFGHVLGLRHEQQQPLADIPWNTAAVYAYYAQQDGWSKEEVDQQVLNKNAPEYTPHTDFDRKSIMQYPVPAALTTNEFSIGYNTDLSPTDKSFIQMMYSGQRIRIRHAATGYGGNITVWLNGIYHTLRAGEVLSVPIQSSGNELSIWEQNAGVWDDGYTPASGKNYRIVLRAGSATDLTLAAE